MTALFRYTQSHQSKIVERWHENDIDGDGRLSLEEWRAGMTSVILPVSLVLAYLKRLSSLLLLELILMAVGIS